MAGAVFHAPAITRVEGLELAAVVTGQSGGAAQLHRQYPRVDVVPDLENLLSTVRPDLVVIATPNDAHVAQARMALEAGAHVVFDKPVAVTSAEARESEQLVVKQGRVAAAFHNRGWDSDFLTLRQLLEDGRLGRVLRFESRFERWSPTPSGGWRESDDPATAPGLLYDLGTHLIDQAVRIFGPVTRIYAETEVGRAGVGAPDDVFVALRHEGDVVSHLWMSKVAASEGPRLRVGSEAAFVVHDLDDQVGPPTGAGTCCLGWAARGPLPQ
jgi:scyllo-inositol 2-dehydrogenase (NADP+)